MALIPAISAARKVRKTASRSRSAPDSAALKAGIDGQPPNQDYGHGVGHVTPCPRSSFRMGHGACREGIVAYDATTGTDYIGSGGAGLLILERAVS